MNIRFHKNFLKQYKKLSPRQQEQCDKRLILFVENPHHPILNNHTLHGEYKNCHSINMTGNLRVIYEPITKDIVLFITIGTHSNLYE